MQLKMDRRSWPWKKKPSDKTAAEKATATLNSANGSLPSSELQADKDRLADNCRITNYVQISVTTYTQLTGLANQVKTYEEAAKTYEEQAKSYEDQLQTFEEEIYELNDKLLSANSEISSKEELVKQHSKVAEEAVLGWEKAEAEALTLKNQLESVTLAKLTVEDRATHLDGALKECMRQIRNLKEENEHKLQEVTLNKNKQYDRMKYELETKIAIFGQDLMRAEAENDAISRSLQERSNMLIKMSEEKLRAEGEIKNLNSNVESCEREINSLKYELSIMAKEMEIRNEEKNMSIKTAEVANKQQLEGAKKIAKLEAECQRLRSLVRKKLPGPAALAQMKLEVESMGRDHGDNHLRRSHTVRPLSPQFLSNPHSLLVPELSLDSIHKFQKENEFLTERLLVMEEETKMLKEAMAKRNSELQTSRSICAKTTSKLQNLEAQVQAFNQQKIEKLFSQHASNHPCMSSLSEDGNDDTISCAESWSSALIFDVSNIKEKSKDKSMKSENGSHLELMDDFEEMEKLAEEKAICLPENGSLDIKDNKISQELATAISQIHKFVSLSLGKEARAVIEEFSATFDKVLGNKIGLIDFVLALSDVMAKATELRFDFLGYKVNEAEVSSPTCIDKVALPENKPPQGERYSNGCGHISDSSSNPEVPQEANILTGFEPGSCKCSLEEFEQLKAEKDSIERVIYECSQDLEIAKALIKEMEEQLSEVNLELTSSQEKNSLAETQLKCMAESYKTLEKVEDELNVMVDKMRSLNMELEIERTGHQEALARCRDLEEQLQRNEECSVCSSSAAEVDNKAKQEKELETAAEKLAECQETIFLLSKHLKSMRPQSELMSSPERGSHNQDEPITSGMNLQDIDLVEMDTATSPSLERVGSKSPLNLYKFSPSRSPIHRPTKSVSSTPTSEKHSRGFSRFFSSKRKNTN